MVSVATHIEELESRKADIHADLEWMERDITRYTTVSLFDNHIDARHQAVTIGDITIQASRAFKECEPFAYREAYEKWAKELDFSDIEEWVDLVDELADIHDELEELKKNA